MVGWKLGQKSDSPVEVGGLSHIYKVLYIPGGDCGISEPSTVSVYHSVKPYQKLSDLPVKMFLIKMGQFLVFYCEWSIWSPPETRRGSRQMTSAMEAPVMFQRV